MKKYFVLQLKRVMRILPLVLLVAAILAGCLLAVYSQSVAMLDSEQTQLRAKVAMVGSLDDSYLQLGLAALQNMDASRMSIEIVAMEENQAKRAMEQGDIAAMVVVPEGFMESAFHGEILPLKYVTTSGAIGMVALLKDEITSVVDSLLLHAQKGIYGSGNAADAVGANGNKVVNGISLEYVDFILARSKMYSVHEIQSDTVLGLRGHMLSGLMMLLFLLACLPFAPIRIGSDLSLNKTLAARGRGITGQVLCEFGAHFAGLLVIAVLAVLGMCLLGFVHSDWVQLLHILPVVAMAAGLSFLLYEMCSDLNSGVLLQFFVILVLSFISGCLYPIIFFPEQVQVLAHYLPTGLGREQLGGLLTGQLSLWSSLALCAYTVAFFLCALWLRRRRLIVGRG